MKKSSIFFGIIMATFVTITMVSCKDKPKVANNMTGFEQNLTNADSTEVINLVNHFFECAENGRYDEAASMLYIDNVDTVSEEPQPLDNEHIARIKQMLVALPIKRHEINYVKFQETYANEVKCTAIIEDAHDDVPEIKTVFYFKPIDYLGSWKLCMVDSYNGDFTIVKNNKQDSLTNHYYKEMRDKNSAEKNKEKK
mgnify:CR=1 FL=1